MNLSTVTSFPGGATCFAIAPGEKHYLYLCLQRGVIRKFNLMTGRFESNTFLDISESISEVYHKKPFKLPFADERGLLRLVFHPEYNTKGSLFHGVFLVMYSRLADSKLYSTQDKKEVPNPDHMTCIVQFRYTPGNTAEQNKATMRMVMCVPEPEANHNGGVMVFGPGGYLWIGLGDGGGANDEHGRLLTKRKDSFIGNGQNYQSLHGKMLRIEVVPPMGGKQKVAYNIPQNNPFVGSDHGRSEIAAWGLRNPWSASLNSKGELYVGDVGQNRKESINLVTLGGNYGWRATEGDEVFNNEVLKFIRKQKSSVIPPIISYPRKNGVAIVGVNYYEGKVMSNVQGALIFADYSGNVMIARKIEQEWRWVPVVKLGMFLTGMGEDAFGEPYILGFDRKTGKGKLLRILGVSHRVMDRLNPVKIPPPVLSRKDIETIVENGIAMAKRVKSALRKDSMGNSTNTKMHVSVIRRGEKEARLVFSMHDAWEGSKNISKGKAYTAMSFSSDQNALTSRSVGILSQPGKPLWQIGNSNSQGGIIEFPGGIPLYKNGRLIGAVGVSGDGVDQDETVAVAASQGFEAPIDIRSDTVSKINYTGKSADLLLAPGTSKENPRPVVIVGRRQWDDFVATKDYQTPIMLFVSGDRKVTNLGPFLLHAKQFTSINFFATRLESLKGIETFSNLKSLNVSRTMITNKDLEDLKNSIQLTRLDLNGNQISDIRALANLVNLEKLGLACTYVEDLPIGKMKKLKVLDIYQTSLDNVSMKVVKTLPNLKDIDTRETVIDL